jgi:hypothetical protein
MTTAAWDAIASAKELEEKATQIEKKMARESQARIEGFFPALSVKKKCKILSHISVDPFFPDGKARLRIRIAWKALSKTPKTARPHSRLGAAGSLGTPTSAVPSHQPWGFFAG